MITCSTRETWDYVPHAERGADSPAVFTLKPLDLQDRTALYNLGRMDAPAFPWGSWAALAVCTGVAGWKNIRDAHGAELRCAFDRGGKVREDLVAMLPHSLCLELAQEIVARSELTEDDRKN